MRAQGFPAPHHPIAIFPSTRPLLILMVSMFATVLKPTGIVGGLVAIAFSLQGCKLDVPRHQVGNWEAKDSYLTEFSFLPSGADPATGAVLNSCAMDPLPARSQQCSGHGRCAEWFDTVIGDFSTHRLSFCQCDLDWADPECKTRRKSQTVVYVLSMFLGMFGVDQIYLGFYHIAALKFFTLGGFGVWYIFDIVRLGSYPVMAMGDFKVAADLDYVYFVLSLIAWLLVLGFSISVRSIQNERKRKSREIVLLKAEVASASMAAMSGQEPVAPSGVRNGPGMYGQAPASMRGRMQQPRPGPQGYGATQTGPYQSMP